MTNTNNYNGCDASILLDNSSTIHSEKLAGPNINSARGYEVIDVVKSEVELVCPEVVSYSGLLALTTCADVASLSAPAWQLRLGRRDSTTASFEGANSELPGPGSSLEDLIGAFTRHRLSIKRLSCLVGYVSPDTGSALRDLVALSGMFET
ncbi:cationic peroxidase 1-like [Bidens hawaiensis]|uniref:cationic peroxidase 1-like n=1 Tax=Bidens hawaiensis TaxID=980011 RepID=UPI00404B1D7B